MTSGAHTLFLFGSFVFVLEILTFLYYANLKSDDVVTPTISVTTIQRGLREGNFTAALPLVSTGSYHSDPRYRICCLYSSNFDPYRNR